MQNIRVIARLDIKGPNLIKGIHLEGLRVLGDPHDFAEKYYKEVEVKNEKILKEINLYYLEKYKKFLEKIKYSR